MGRHCGARGNLTGRDKSAVDRGAPELLAAPEPLRDDELDVRDAHEGERRAKQRLGMFEGLIRRTVTVDIPTRQGDDHTLALGETDRPVLSALERLSPNDNMVDPGLGSLAPEKL